MSSHFLPVELLNESMGALTITLSVPTCGLIRWIGEWVLYSKLCLGVWNLEMTQWQSYVFYSIIPDMIF